MLTKVSPSGWSDEWDRVEYFYPDGSHTGRVEFKPRPRPPAAPTTWESMEFQI
jgi:hypothetical protein